TSPANLDDRSIRHGSFAKTELSCHKVCQDPNRSLGQFALGRLIFGELIDSWWVLYELHGQIEQFAASAIDNRNLLVIGNQHNSLVHVLKRKVKLIRFLSCLRVYP